MLHHVSILKPLNFRHQHFKILYFVKYLRVRAHDNNCYKVSIVVEKFSCTILLLRKWMTIFLKTHEDSILAMNPQNTSFLKYQK